MDKPRALHKVIDRILAEVPIFKVSLRAQLKSIRESYLYAPPEGQRLWWYETCKALEEELHDPNLPAALDWERRVSAIITGKN